MMGMKVAGLMLTVMAAVAMSGASVPLPAHGAGPTAPPPFKSDTADFARFADKTANLPDEERVRLFHAHFDKLFPGFYVARFGDSAKYDARIATALRDFTSIRDRYTAASAEFANAFARGGTRFRKFFPDYRLTMTVFLVHSIGEMDGGSREIGGRKVMVFGADVIAKIHDQTTIGPFLDHELFHIYHASYFPDCDEVWCSLWQEGMAVYVASRMNPGANDRQLELTLPQPIRPGVEPRLREAMCLIREKFESVDKDDYATFFVGHGKSGPFPPRFGYYLGYVLAQKIGTSMSLERMAKLPPAKVKPLLEQALATYGPCPVAGV
jgi:hypothetical protein